MNNTDKRAIYSTSCDKAQWAVIGFYDGAGGVLAWLENEFDAHRCAKEIRRLGGQARVAPAPRGEMSKENRDSVMGWVMKAMEQ